MAGHVKFKVVIPSRFASTRLPGKALLPIAGRSLIARVWDRGMASGAEEVIVATDDERIASEVKSCGGQAVMTSKDHVSGTDRLAEVVAIKGWSDDAIIINLQGDEPCIPEQILSQVAESLKKNRGAGIATLATPIDDASELFNDNAVKVVLDRQGMAQYFSRAPLPWVRGVFAPGQMPETLPKGVSFLRHIGIYAYRARVLREIASHPQVAAERAESLEQLRALAMGIGIHVTVIDKAPPPGVDTAEDLRRAELEFQC